MPLQFDIRRNLRWDPYVLRHGQTFEHFWSDHLKAKRDVLFILGRGFDPRMTTGPEAILQIEGDGRRDCLLIHFDEGASSPSKQHEPLVRDNVKCLNRLFDGRGSIETRLLEMWADDGHRRRRVGARNAAGLLDAESIASYSDIVVDVSALPRAIYFPLVGKLLYLLDAAGPNRGNLHVTVAENMNLDRRIREIGPDESASYIPGFASSLDLEASEDIPKVWIPILGEGQATQLERIFNHVSPDEVSPLLPSPSSYPRRGDALLMEYRDLLFDAWRVEPADIIYASERNPFEVYRQIMSTVSYYTTALQPLGGCRAVVSALSSKLLSIGGILAAYDSKRGQGGDIAIAHVEVQGYQIEPGGEAEPSDEPAVDAELFTLWLAGKDYA